MARGEVEPQPEHARARDRLAAFRRELYQCVSARADALFELADAVLCVGELRRSAVIACQGKPVTPRMLSRELKELQQRGLRERYSRSPGPRCLPAAFKVELVAFGIGRG